MSKEDFPKFKLEAPANDLAIEWGKSFSDMVIEPALADAMLQPNIRRGSEHSFELSANDNEIITDGFAASSDELTTLLEEKKGTLRNRKSVSVCPGDYITLSGDSDGREM